VHLQQPAAAHDLAGHVRCSMRLSSTQMRHCTQYFFHKKINFSSREEYCLRPAAKNIDEICHNSLNFEE